MPEVHTLGFESETFALITCQHACNPSLGSIGDHQWTSDTFSTRSSIISTGSSTISTGSSLGVHCLTKLQGIRGT
ncbi:unnamed protein product [Closterium sp. NIES-54]